MLQWALFFLLILYSLCLKWKIEYLLLVWDSEVLEPAELAGFVSLYLISSDPAPYWSLRNSSALQELVPPSLVPPFIFYFFKQWGLFADKHLLEHSVLAFQIASTGERLTASSEDCLVFYLRMSIIQNVCLWLVPAEILSHRHSSCCLLPPQASHRHADLMPIPRPLMALIGTICASHYNPLVPPPPLLR